MDNNLQIPLNLPDVRIVEVCKTDKKDWLIKVESTLNQTNCHKCGERSTVVAAAPTVWDVVWAKWAHFLV